MKPTETKPDFTVRSEGSLFIFTPETEAVKEWFQENTEAQYFGGFVVESQYAFNIYVALSESGFVGE